MNTEHKAAEQRLDRLLDDSQYDCCGTHHKNEWEKLCLAVERKINALKQRFVRLLTR